MADQAHCNQSEASDMELGYSASVMIERTKQNERMNNFFNRHSLLGKSYLGWDHQGKRITVPNDDDALSKLSCDMLPKLSNSVLSLLRNNEEISQSTKLKNWCIYPAIGKRGIKIVGYKCDNGKCRESTVIKHRLKNNLVVSETFRYYTLVGPLVCTDGQVPLSTTKAFENGFPMGWKNEVDLYLKWFDEKNTKDECCTPVGKINTRLLIREKAEVNDDDDNMDDEQELTSLDVGEEDVTVLQNPQINEVSTETEDSEGKTEDYETMAEADNVTCRLSLSKTDKDLSKEDEYLKENTENDNEKPAPADDNCFKLPLSNPPSENLEKFPIQKTDGIKLSNWSVIIIFNTPVIEGLVQCEDGKVRIYRSSGIARVTRRKRNVITQSGTKYILVGKMDKAHSLHNGMPEKIADKFMYGFPRNWQALIEQCQINTSNSSISVARKSTSAKRSRPRTLDKTFRRSDRSLDDDIIKDLRSLFESADSEEENDKPVKVAIANAKSSTAKKQTKKTPSTKSRKQKATSKPVSIHESVEQMEVASPVITRRSRSRKLSKTPVLKKSPKKSKVKTLNKHKSPHHNKNQSREDLNIPRKRRRESSPAIDFLCSLDKVVVQLGSRVDLKQTGTDDKPNEEKPRKTTQKRKSSKRKSTNKSKKEVATADVVDLTIEKHEESPQNTNESKSDKKKSTKRTTHTKKNMVVIDDTEDDETAKKGRGRKSKGAVKTNLSAEKKKKAGRKSTTLEKKQTHSHKSSEEPPKKKKRKSTTIVVEETTDDKKESPKKLLKIGEWTKTENTKLKRLTKDGNNHDWDEISEKFGRSADDCKNAYGMLFVCKPKKRKATKKPIPKKIEITAGKGTLKRREQIFQAYESLKPTQPVEDFFNFDKLSENDNNFWSGISNLQATPSTNLQAQSQSYATPSWCKGNGTDLAETPKTTALDDIDVQSCYTPLATRFSPEHARRENHKINVHLKKTGLTKVKLTKKMKVDEKNTKIKFVPPNLKDITNMENSFLSDDSMVQDEYFSFSP